MMRVKGQNIENVKVINRSSTFRLLLANGPLSRIDIAAELNVTPATVTSICNELLQKNLLVQHEELDSPGKVGRKKCPVGLNYDYKHVLSIAIFPDSATLSICNLAASLVDSVVVPTRRSLSPDLFLAHLAERCIKLLWDNQLAKDRILGVGVAVLGPVNHIEGISLKAYSIWEQPVPVRRLLENELHIPVYVESNVCALIEAALLYGEIEHPNVLAVQWGPGIGSVSVIGGKVFKGRNFHTAELGHNFVDGIGERCRCGKVGCLETKLSVDAIAAEMERLSGLAKAKALRALRDRVGPPCRENLDKYLEVAFPPLEDYLKDISFRLAVVVNNAVQVLAPDRIILFGELFANNRLLEYFKEKIFSINETIVDDMFLRSDFQSRHTYIGATACIVKHLLVDTGGLNEAAKTHA
ncbi:MAG: ROK family protein [Planctomycetota bacterium]|jgi:predicted NBD/HSP70 family sugar kinase|nr:ROK family protein [Planctomycetota bacterium]